VLISSRCHLRLAWEDCEADIRTLSVCVPELIDTAIMKIVHLNSFGFTFPEVCVFFDTGYECNQENSPVLEAGSIGIPWAYGTRTHGFFACFGVV